jgi:hypothetical protein
MKTDTREHTYLKLDTSTKATMRDIAKYRHTTLANLIEEGARMVIHRERNRIREDMTDLSAVNQMVGH